MKKKSASNPLWFKDATIYQLHVKTFADGNGDGIGDFTGLMEKLDYLENLGVTAIWMLPFYPSPLRDDGYDIADYYSVNPQFGTIDDFQALLKEAHRRGLKVITELVLNHTSDQNAWFQKSRRAQPGSEWRDFYVWNDSPQKYQDARIIFKDFETSNWSWDPVAQAYFWHRFYSHQPDLNFENPKVHTELLKVIDFWMEMGVDGLRLDAVPYLYEREGTNCENLPETHAFLKKLRKHIDDKFVDRMLLAEANQWPEDAVNYMGTGDECQMNFHFPLMPRMFMALQMEDRFPLIDILDQTPAIPEGCQWATFLRNHDELTLEMVTDEERDYMYRMYASDSRARINLGIRRRLAPLMANSRRKIELINILLMSLPGTPIIYYGDEIGMGDNIYLGDRNGVRTPMQWSPDRNAGFSKANPQQLFLPVTIDPEYHYEACNVENHEKNLSSLLWWMRRVISMRKKYKAFGHGTIEFLLPDNGKVLTFIRAHEDETILVVVNLSRFSQVVELDLSRFAGRTPTEVFSANPFPTIRETPYIFTLAAHDHFWLELPAEKKTSGEPQEVPSFDRTLDWAVLLDGEDRELIEEEILPVYVPGCRWFGGKAKPLRDIKVVESIKLEGKNAARVLFLQVSYADSSSDVYLLPVQIATGEAAGQISQAHPKAVIARFSERGRDGILYDAIYDEAFRATLYKMITKGTSLAGDRGQVTGIASADLTKIAGKKATLSSRVLAAEQSNSSIIYGDKLFLKLYRKLEEGVNPDAELTRFLSERQNFEHVPPFAGSIEYKAKGKEPRVLGIMIGMVPNSGDAWAHTLDAVGRYFERVLTVRGELEGLAQQDCDARFDDLLGGVYTERARLIGQRTGQMHRALAADVDDPQFAPEAFSTLYQRSVYQSMRGSTKRMFQLLHKQAEKAPKEVRPLFDELLGSEEAILQRQGRIIDHKILASKIRIHGDYHLGQLLFTGRDFVIIDFEGEPSRSLSERKLKRSPLRDVAGMIRSFDYAPQSALAQLSLREEDAPFLQPWSERWSARVSEVFLEAYLEEVKGAAFIPESREDFDVLLDAFTLDKAIYEVSYELNNRPAWVGIPIRGIRKILNS